MAKSTKTAEDLFLEAWNEFGYSGSDIQREYKFHPTRRWRFDFAFVSKHIAVEIDGRGRHQTVTGVRNDCEKANAAVELGWVILHIPTSDIRGKNKLGEPLLELFIELVCRVLSSRENYDERSMDKEVAELREVPAPLKRETPRIIQRKHPGPTLTRRGGPGSDGG